MITGVDHVVKVVLDLDAVIAEHRRDGFTVTPGGVHAGGESHNALIGFQDGSYLELIAFIGTKPLSEHRWGSVAQRGGGWADFALGSNDLLTDADALGDLVERAQDGGRERPDGLRLAWRVALLRRPVPFLIEDLTARELRAPHGEAARHANGVTGIAAIELGARDIASVAEGYARLRERGAPGISIAKAERDGLMDVRFAG